MPDSTTPAPSAASADAAASASGADKKCRPAKENVIPTSYARIDLGDVTPHNLKQLKRVNAVVFPVVYHDKFYKDVLEAGELAKLAYFNDLVVGAVCCRVDVGPAPACERKLYIMTLGCLAPYRRLGIGTTMLDHVMDVVEKDGNFHAVFLHVQINNDSAINFYRNFGFDIVETKEQYYKRIEPADAHVLEKRLKPRAEVNGDGAEDGVAPGEGGTREM